MARLSPMVETPCSSTPSAGSRAASQVEFVSVSSPMSNSVPIEKISAFTRTLPWVSLRRSQQRPGDSPGSLAPQRTEGLIPCQESVHCPCGTALYLPFPCSRGFPLVSVCYQCYVAQPATKSTALGYDSILRTEGGVVMDFYNI